MGEIKPEVTVDRQHRYVLRTGDKDDLFYVHERALAAFTTADREAVLDQLDHAIALGGRPRPDDSNRIARIFVLAERRRPGSALNALDDTLRRRLAEAVVAEPEMAILISGYDDWDGAEPEIVEHFEVPSKTWADVHRRRRDDARHLASGGSSGGPDMGGIGF